MIAKQWAFHHQLCIYRLSVFMKYEDFKISKTLDITPSHPVWPVAAAGQSMMVGYVDMIDQGH